MLATRHREFLVANLAGKVRRVTRNGKTWLVAPCTILKEGVLAGSKGPLLYPAPEVAARPGVWNNVPLTLYHPTHPINGEALSVRDPGVLKRQGIGFIQNDRCVGGDRRLVDAWFDEHRLRKLSPDTCRRLLANEPISVSTGLYTENELAPVGATFNGRPYTHIARDYRPDHLAVLPDQVGACSLADGCGVLVGNRKRGSLWNTEREYKRDEQGKFSVGESLTHSHPVIGESPAEFRGYHQHPETGEKMARVILRRPGEAPFETSVKPSELRRGEEETPESDEALLKDKEGLKKLSRELFQRKQQEEKDISERREKAYEEQYKDRVNRLGKPISHANGYPIHLDEKTGEHVLVDPNNSDPETREIWRGRGSGGKSGLTGARRVAKSLDPPVSNRSCACGGECGKCGPAANAKDAKGHGSSPNYRLKSSKPPKGVFGLRRAIYSSPEGHEVSITHSDYSHGMRTGSTLGGYSTVTHYRSDNEPNSMGYREPNSEKEFSGVGHEDKAARYAKRNFGIEHEHTSLPRYGKTENTIYACGGKCGKCSTAPNAKKLIANTGDDKKGCGDGG